MAAQRGLQQRVSDSKEDCSNLGSSSKSRGPLRLQSSGGVLPRQSRSTARRNGFARIRGWPICWQIGWVNLIMTASMSTQVAMTSQTVIIDSFQLPRSDSGWPTHSGQPPHSRDMMHLRFEDFRVHKIDGGAVIFLRWCKNGCRCPAWLWPAWTCPAWVCLTWAWSV